MVSRGVFYLVTAALFLLGILFILYQRVTFDMPFFPGETREVWTIEAKIEFEPITGSAATVDLALPGVQPGFTQIRQSTASLGYGSSYIQRGSTLYMEWTKRNNRGLQTLYYRADFLRDPEANESSMVVPRLSQSVITEPYLTAMNDIAEMASNKSSNPFSFAVQVISEINKDTETNTLLLSQFSKADLIVHIMHSANIPARIVGILELEDGRRNRSLSSRVAVFDGDTYEIFNPYTGVSGLQDNELIWANHSRSLLDVSGGTNARVSFSMLRELVDAGVAGHLKARAEDVLDANVISLSLDSLPIEEQTVFKNILLLPIGVLITVFLRLIVGIKTSGTFMPVLISMAFLQTTLFVGLIGFVSIVCIGLVVRSWLSHLNLLLVARISTVIIVVIGIIAAISFFTYRVGLTEGIKVTFFPMIILSWTIERMSILWEEEGPKEVLIQGSGSLFVAVCAFIAMSSFTIQHLTFNFLGLQFIILALVMIMGNYTGFRLSELKRFKPLGDQIRDYQNGDTKGLEADRLKAEAEELKQDPHVTLRKWKERVKEQEEHRDGEAGDPGQDKDTDSQDKDDGKDRKE